LIILALLLGTAIGLPAARRVKMTAMPQMVALFNGVGGRGGGDHRVGRVPPTTSAATTRWKVEIPSLFAAIVGSISFWGSNIAFGKLQAIIPSRPIKLPGQANHQRRAVRDRRRQRDHPRLRYPLPGAVHPRDPGDGGAARNMVVLPIGGADMPVVISLLNGSPAGRTLTSSLAVPSRA